MPLTSLRPLTQLGRVGHATVLGCALPLLGWMACAPLSMAVVAPAFVKVDLNRLRPETV